MKKKILLTALALACVMACALCFTACNDDPIKVSELLIAKAGEEPQPGISRLNFEISYGEKPDFNYKLYVRYSDGDIKELSPNDEKLSVSYSYYGYETHTAVPISELPDKYITGDYTAEYSYDGLDQKTSVCISVVRANAGNFTVRPQKTTWFCNEKLPTVTVLNPQGMSVGKLAEGDTKMPANDTRIPYGEEFDNYVIVKSAYDAFGAEQKVDYEYLTNYMYTHQQGEFWQYFDSDTDAALPVGEYMLFALIGRTYNYQNIVTPAVQISVKDSFAERTFVFQNIILRDGEGNEITDTDVEYVGMTADIKQGNSGKTVICKQNGELRGTVDFGGGPFDGLENEDVLVYENDADTLYLYRNGQVGLLIGEGTLVGNTLTLEMPIEGTPYKWIITFIGQ